jgi:ABC-type Co2+ transport system permease subunit
VTILKQLIPKVYILLRQILDRKLKVIAGFIGAMIAIIFISIFVSLTLGALLAFVTMILSAIYVTKRTRIKLKSRRA